IGAYEKPPAMPEDIYFVFAFFITRRNASQLGEGKKECEEKHFIENHYGLPILKLTVSKK
ncbi:hypothetical protein CQP34_21240, partial [Yersinia pestis]